MRRSGVVCRHAAYANRLKAELQGIADAGTWKTERVIVTPQDHAIGVDDKTVLNFCANNYLGLANDPSLVDAAKEAIDSHGLGLASVRFICGTQDIHKQLEQSIAEFHGLQDSILYNSCFDANAGIFEVLLGPEDAVISDELNHASIIDGVRLCKAQRFRYKNRNMEDLEEQLKASAHCGTRMIVTDGVFSMDGTIAPLDQICDLADKYDALVMTDECHSTGFMGKTGRGIPELLGCMDRVDIVNSTLGKALGGATGGYTAASADIVQLLRQRSRPYLFSNSVAPAVVGAGIKMFEILGSSTALRDQLEENTSLFRSKMAKEGFQLGGSPEHPICPIMIGDAALASKMAEEMLKRNIYVIGFSFPVVPKEKARVRVQISASHTTDDINRAVESFAQVAKQLGILKD